MKKKKLKQRAKEMLKNPTKHEEIFSKRLTEKGIQFKQQQLIDYYIVDFLVGNIVIEVDGYYHFTKEGIKKDKKRTAYLEACGLVVRRVLNSKVETVDIDFLLAPPPAKKETKVVGSKDRLRTQKTRSRKQLNKKEKVEKKIENFYNTLSARDLELQKRYDKLKQR